MRTMMNHEEQPVLDLYHHVLLQAQIIYSKKTRPNNIEQYAINCTWDEADL